ncbi:MULTISPECIES: sulfotransferase [unclassified Mesorhizobium]|uniref:tetratricopeptide repeat-containing sulfotransferase family protein n=1 Tax=unclassified Mesorhizobium TaxID=325217 RepID=UPI000FCA12D2|nr:MULTISPECIES: sulfotransferase [unclassified Mesorhizobium]RUX90747.1 sulfotransferase family protein [Mesorhizobium sp. M7D.F.Ca.US.004.01.2.1]RVA28678.1 sulfotransferase family protein [Mesorhizobium sp. M7D.F.Ca.US.004.03.1.1]
MSNRLPPAWSKHLKGPAGPKISQQKIMQPTAVPLSRAQADEALLRQALQLQEAKRLVDAEELCLRVLARTPNHTLALYILGTLGLGVDDELAIKYFARAAAQEPNNPYYQLSLGEACLKAGDYPPAIRHLQRACELKPDLMEALCGLGKAYSKFDKADLALLVYEKALKLDPDDPAVRTDLANALVALGRMDEAAARLKSNIAQRVNVPASYNTLVGIRKFATEPAELQSILDELGSTPVLANELYLLHLAAGKILNDLERYDEAMDHFLKAATAKGYSFDIDSYRRQVDSLIGLFTPEFLAARADYGDPSEAPVFVLGMPRSGTTLTEQICSSHPDVHGAGELTKLGRMAVVNGLKAQQERIFGQPVRSMTSQQSKVLAGEYLSNLRLYAPTASQIIDKMPHNFELIGFIALLFPHARIIHCTRDPIDNCFSCFLANLNRGHQYSSDLTVLGLYYREYDRLIRHWKALLPGRIFENRYEDLVSDQEGQSRRLIEHLGLAWDDACLRFFDKAGSVRTLSRWQVRQPIYRSSVKRWKNYEGRLRPLIETLGDLVEL